MIATQVESGLAARIGDIHIGTRAQKQANDFAVAALGSEQQRWFIEDAACVHVSSALVSRQRLDGEPQNLCVSALSSKM